MCANLLRLCVIGVCGSLIFAAAAHADWIQIYQHNSEGGASTRYYLPEPGNDYLSGIDYWVGSVRRTGSQLQGTAGGVLFHGASSFRIWAADTDVTLYLFEGDHFDGRMLRYRVAKGHTGLMYDSGWFNDRLGSFIAVREKVGQTELEQLIDTPIPLDGMVSQIRNAFAEQLEADGDVEDFWLHNTQVNYDTAHSLWLEIGANTDYWAKYYDIIRIRQDIEIDPDWWPFNYDTWVKLGYYFYADSTQHLAFLWSAWAVWVEGGLISGKIEDGLSTAVGGSLEANAQKMRGAIKDAIEEQAGIFAPAIWDGVRRVGWLIRCDNFNSLSGYSHPASPYCWAFGSRKHMFPPTLVLHHDVNEP